MELLKQRNPFANVYFFHNKYNAGLEQYQEEYRDEVQRCIKEICGEIKGSYKTDPSSGAKHWQYGVQTTLWEPEEGC